MRMIDIEIEDTKLADLGIEQEKTYTNFWFDESKLSGFWFGCDGESIHFYLGSLSFLCENNEKNIKLLKSIIQ